MFHYTIYIVLNMSHITINLWAWCNTE